VVDLNGHPLSPCTPEKVEQNVRDGLAHFSDGILHLHYRPLAYRRVYRQVRRRDGWVCAWCGGPGSTLDHVIPICWGGQTTIDNCVIACRACNHSRNNALPSQFIRWTGLEPSHPVIQKILAREAYYLQQAEISLAERPLSACLSREEAQVWVAYRQGELDRVRPTPPEAPLSRLKGEGKLFGQYFVP
jgi:hypothetical protein